MIRFTRRCCSVLQRVAVCCAAQCFNAVARCKRTCLGLTRTKCYCSVWQCFATLWYVARGQASELLGAVAVFCNAVAR